MHGLQCRNDEDLVLRYKAPEGTALERASLLRAESEAARRLEPRGELALSINGGEAVRLGDRVTCTVKLLGQEGEQYPTPSKK